MVFNVGDKIIVAHSRHRVIIGAVCIVKDINGGSEATIMPCSMGDKQLFIQAVGVASHFIYTDRLTHYTEKEAEAW